MAYVDVPEQHVLQHEPCVMMEMIRLQTISRTVLVFVQEQPVHRHEHHVTMVM